MKESNNIKSNLIKKGTWIEITSNKNGLTFLGRVTENYIVNGGNSKFLILDNENDYRLIESNNIKKCKMQKDLDFNIDINASPIIS
jgi:hypothetical protein